MQAEKKLAITVFSFPPDKGNVGIAAYLNVFSSIYSVLKELHRDGYNVEGLPETSEALIEDVIHDKEAQFSSPNLNIAYKMGVVLNLLAIWIALLGSNVIVISLKEARA